MPDDSQSNAGAVEFMQCHLPGLTDGDYKITVKQTVNTSGNSKIPETIFTTAKEFTVAGERFALNPSDIHSVFPPDGNLGEHSNVLPHIILNRSTLPWERRAENTPGKKKGAKENVPVDKREIRAPWLALLLFDEDEKPLPMLAQLTFAEPSRPIIKILGPSTAPDKGGKFPKLIPQNTTPPADGNSLELESGQHDGDMLTVIDIEKSMLESLMPRWEDLKLLAHVRQGKDPEDDPTGEELAVIICNRLPQKDKSSTVHLVSVEGRYKKVEGNPEDYEFDYQGAGQGDLIRLVSLKSWRFTCNDPDKTFKGLLLNLNQHDSPRSTLRLPEKANTSHDARAENFLSQGYVLLPHYLRHSDREKKKRYSTASWYHGPLIPGRSTATEISLPVAAADALLRYDHAIGMFDVSYAAAWELGRLLSLQNKAFSIGLYQWKRQHAQQLAQVEQQLTHLPFAQPATTETPPLPYAISSWFEKLRNLEGIPFNYLVPDERMLPVESIRFFRVDDMWVGCLLDGAFSIGRVTTSDHDKDRSHGEKSPAANPPKTVTGFLLRSEVVSGWPELLVDAYSDQEGNHTIPSLRMERLSANVLICLFEGEMKRVDIHEKPETLHFGLDKPDTKQETPTSDYHKTLRDKDGAQIYVKGTDHEPLTVKVDSTLWSASQRVINISGLAQAIAHTLPDTSPPLAAFTSAQFALQMVEGVEKVIFVAQT